MKLGIEGYHAIVTGGSRGIGKSIVEGLLKEGVNVSYCARTVTGKEYDHLPELELETGVKTRPRVSGTSVDLCNTESIKPWVEKAVEEFGRLDIVVSNASPMQHDWEVSFKGDILACVELINCCAPHLEKSTAPSIVLNGSYAQSEIIQLPGVGELSPYGPHKAAVAHISGHMSHLLGPKGIRVNVVSAGLIMHPGSAWDLWSQHLPEETDKWLSRVNLGPKRWGTPEEVADAVVYLCSRRASYISGAALQVAGAMQVGIQY